MQIALVPFNPIIADINGNAERILTEARHAAEFGADLVVFPELALTGYPPRDLLLRTDVLDAVDNAVTRLAERLGGISVLLGSPRRERGRLMNSALLIRNARVEFTYDKRLLPNYDVFDEPRYFNPGTGPVSFKHLNTTIGIAVCEDLWRAEDVPGAPGYADLPDPLDALRDAKPDLILCLSASPFVARKDLRQQEILSAAAKHTRATVLSINQLGANDDLIFDGAAHLATPSDPLICLSSPRFASRTSIINASTHTPPPFWTTPQSPDPQAELWQALTLGVRDYARKNRFKSAVLGLSGGIDSALVAAIAAAALGPANVTALSMPSRYSSTGSRTDAHEQANRTGINLHEIPIEAAHNACESLLSAPFQDAGLDAKNPGIAEENVQSRLRGLLVMAFSNKACHLPLATGNKSELAVGYCTLYGDMNGGLAPIADLYKTQVYELAEWLNQHHQTAGFTSPPIPEKVLSKAPSAELRHDQTDQDTLPPYSQLDLALKGLIEQRLGINDIIGQTNLSPEVVQHTARLLQSAEHKRRQLTTGLKVSGCAFGPGRRVPITKSSEATPSELTSEKIS